MLEGLGVHHWIPRSKLDLSQDHQGRRCLLSHGPKKWFISVYRYEHANILDTIRWFTVYILFTLWQNGRHRRISRSLKGCHDQIARRTNGEEPPWQLVLPHHTRPFLQRGPVAVGLRGLAHIDRRISHSQLTERPWPSHGLVLVFCTRFGTEDQLQWLSSSLQVEAVSTEDDTVGSLPLPCTGLRLMLLWYSSYPKGKSRVISQVDSILHLRCSRPIANQAVPLMLSEASVS